MGGRTATDEALLIGAYARSNSLLHPRNAALMGEFIKTRNPEVWDQLVANLKKTPQRAQTEAEQARSLAESQIVNFLTQNMGGGDYAEHMIAAGDPIQMASLLVPYLKAGKLIGGAGRTTGGVVREIAKTAMTEMGIESLQTLVENPDAKLSDFEQMSLDYLMGTLGMGAMNKGVSKVMRALPGNLPVPNEKNGSSGDAAGGAAGTPPDSGAGAQATAAPAGVPKPEKAPAQAAAAEAVPQPDEVPQAVTAGGDKVEMAPWEGNPQEVTARPDAPNAPQAVGATPGGGASPPGLVAQQGGGQPATDSGSGSSSGGSANSAGGGAGAPLQVGGGGRPAANGGQGRGSSGVSVSGQQGNSSQSAAKAQEDGANPHSKDTANEVTDNIPVTKPRLLNNAEWLVPQRPEHVLPVWPYDPNRKSKGPRKVLSRKDTDEGNRRGVEGENEAADILAQHGYDYQQIKERNKSPDGKFAGIDDKTDAYSPTKTKSVKGIRGEIVRKVEQQNAPYVMVRLEPDGQSINELFEHIRKTPVEGLKQLFVIKSGKLYILY